MRDLVVVLSCIVSSALALISRAMGGVPLLEESI